MTGTDAPAAAPGAAGSGPGRPAAWLPGLRWVLGTVGVVSLLALGVLRATGLTALLGAAALVALASLALAALAQAVEAASARRGGFPTAMRRHRASQGTSARAWRLTALAVGLLAAAACQTWFRAGTVIASGDLTPPDGTGWIVHLFSPWAWSGSNLGGPSALATQLPWAAVLAVVHHLGGSAAIAQRVWLTLLFTGAALAALGCLRALGLLPVPAAVGAFVYVLNPYVLTEVGVNSVYLAALLLLPLLVGLVVSAATGRRRIRTTAVWMAATAPLLGVADLNPPLVGMLGLAVLGAAGLAPWLGGRRAGARAVRLLALAIPLTVVSSAYWLVPTLLQLTAVPTASLAGVAAWAWTEGRATVANAFWLNTTWAWPYPEYFPFAPGYAEVPLVVLKFLLPATGFAALLGPRLRPGTDAREVRRLRLSAAAALAALLVILLSTGTQPPGALLFDALYRLPYGWLLREPGRFLMVVGLAYGVLVGAAVQVLLRSRVLSSWRLSLSAGRLLPPAVGLVAAAVTAAIPGFPLLLGSVVPDQRPVLPPAHVRVPGWWYGMAAYLNRGAPQGRVLMLPPDDFYQMPYTWGYYGTDGFITDMVSRPVLDPTGQGYTPATADLQQAVVAVATSLVDHRWRTARSLLAALGTQLVLVRGDVAFRFPGRDIISPVRLDAALARDPLMTLAHRDGALRLYAAAATALGPSVAAHLATVDTRSPDLRVLPVLAAGTAVVTHRPIPGVVSVRQLPPYRDWTVRGRSPELTVATQPGRRYRLWGLAGGGPEAIPRTSRSGPRRARTTLAATWSPHRSVLRLTVSGGPELLRDGGFARGPWQRRVGSCTTAPGAATKELAGRVILGGGPGGSPALQLRAPPSAGTACEAQRFPWSGGPLWVRLWVRHQQGRAPRICLWQYVSRQCTAMPALPAGGGWRRYSTVVAPTPGNRLGLFLYADGVPGRSATVAEYALVSVTPVAAPSVLDLVGTPVARPSAHPSLLVQPQAYSRRWTGPSGSRHVLVDGLVNGWLERGRPRRGPVAYPAARLVRLGQSASALCWLAIALAAGLASAWSRRGGRWG